MILAEAYRLLELDRAASDDAVHAAWRDLTKVWHPDRFAHDAELQRKAQEKLKAINQAFETIRDSRSGTGRRGSRPEGDARGDRKNEGAAWRVRAGEREWPARDLDEILAWASAGRFGSDAEILGPNGGGWIALESLPEGKAAFARSRARRARGWAIALTAAGIFFLLRRPTLGGFVIALAFLLCAAILFMRAR
ncbi:MAG TPA: J domain-containing protein [Thermoanaerobaculia bacterium]|nr:J domain-containing protein [Thermoanaerobaculia bacterium]